MSQNTQRLTFLGLVVAVLGARTIASGSPLIAIGAGVVEIPVATMIGRIVLWFADKVFLFARNVMNPEAPRNAVGRTIWQTLSLSLGIGFPLSLLLGRLG